MNTPRDPNEILSAWLDEGPTRLPDQTRRAIVAGLPTVIQRWRLSWVPWRFPIMSAPIRLAAVIAVVAIVGYAALNFLSPVVGPGSAPPPSPTATPVPSPTTAPTLPPGITGWKTYTSAVYGFKISYPEDWTVYEPATRTWQAGDRVTEPDPYQDIFASPEEATVGLFAWQMPADATVDSAEWDSMVVWAEGFCADFVNTACEGISDRAIQVYRDGTGIFAHSWLILPSPDRQFAFYASDGVVTVVMVAREDNYPSAARYGGSVQLLRSILEATNAAAIAGG